MDGGYRSSVRWNFSSGCDHASWALLGALVVGAQGKPVDFMTVLVPRVDYEIADVWDVVGLRGTGSNDIIVDGAFVPEHRAIRNFDMAQLSAPGQRVNPGLCSPRRSPRRWSARSPAAWRPTWTRCGIGCG